MTKTPSCVVAEVVGLHRFLARWLGGKLEPGDADFERFAGSHAEDFSIVTTEGNLLGRRGLLAALRAAHGRRPGLNVEVSDVALRHQAGHALVVTFEERHEEGNETTARLTTAFLRAAERGPNGLEWLHVHEARVG